MIVMPNRTGRCSGPTSNEYIGPIYEGIIHVVSECEGEECEGEECEGYEHPFLALSSWKLPNTAAYLIHGGQWTKVNLTVQK